MINSYTPGFNLVQVLVQDLLLQSLLKVLEDFRRCYIQCIYIKKEKIKLFITDLFSLSYFMLFSLWYFGSVNSLE